MDTESSIEQPAVRGRRRRKPQVYVSPLEAATAAGDLMGVVQATVLSYSFCTRKPDALVLGCIKKLSAKGPAGFISAIAEHMLQYDTLLLVRAQVTLSREIGDLDARDSGQSFLSDLSEGAIQMIDRVARIEDRLLQTAKAFAQIMHLLALGERPAKAGGDRQTKALDGALIAKLADWQGPDESAGT